MGQDPSPESSPTFFKEEKKMLLLNQIQNSCIYVLLQSLNIWNVFYGLLWIKRGVMRFEICLNFIFHTAFQLFWIWGHRRIANYNYQQKCYLVLKIHVEGANWWWVCKDSHFFFSCCSSIPNIVMGCKSSCREVLEDLMKRAEFWEDICKALKN